MNETRKKQVMTLSILAVAISAISIGFAAFSSNLNISSNLAVSPDESTFGVKFSSSATELATNPVVPTKNPTTLTASNGAINNEGDPTITGLSVDFTEPGQKVEYTFYARNTGKYDAYLNAIIFESIGLSTTNKVCTPGKGANKDTVDAACNSISIKVNYNGETYDSTQSTTLDLLAIGASRPVTVTIEYAAGGVRADGPFSISFGDIRLIYSTVADYVIPDEVAKICTPVTGDDLNYKYAYYSDGQYLLGEATYTTGTKSIGDAYRCQVNDEDSYIFNIIGQDTSGNYNLLLNHNLGEAADDNPDTLMTTLSNLTSTWKNILARTDSYSDTYSDDASGEHTYTFNYTGLYARLIEYTELKKFAPTDTWSENSKPWISSVPKDTQDANSNAWKYISSDINGAYGGSYAYEGLECGVGTCTLSFMQIRPVITVPEGAIQ